MRIRTVPSLTSYQLILSVPEGYHKKTGALLVRNPCMKELKKPLSDLPCGLKELELIARILKTQPLTGRQATEGGELKWMSSVGLIHISAPKTFLDRFAVPFRKGLHFEAVSDVLKRPIFERVSWCEVAVTVVEAKP